MSKSKNKLLPKLDRILRELGENLKLSRLRRKLSATQVSERAGLSRTTLYLMEKGSDSVSIGSYLNVLNVLGLETDFLLLAKDDVLGRKLQDLDIKTFERSPKKR